jgi:hypothetical protein
MIESGLIEREVKKHVDKLTDKCITEAFEEW